MSLSHLDDEGRARMIDVGAKTVTRREAIATGRLETTAEVVTLVLADALPKADVLATEDVQVPPALVSTAPSSQDDPLPASDDGPASMEPEPADTRA